MPSRLLAGGIALLVVSWVPVCPASSTPGEPPSKRDLARGMRGSKHDLTALLGSAGRAADPRGEMICTFCHNSAGAAAATPQLWSRQALAGGFRMYGSASAKMQVASAPQRESLLCLSCHDGTLAFDQLPNPAGIASGGDPGPSERSALARAPGWMGGEVTNLGRDLSNDHPISVTYDPSRSREYRPSMGGKIGPLPLFGENRDQLECMTCHEPHNGTYPPFLRMSNADSALCTTCHIK